MALGEVAARRDKGGGQLDLAGKYRLIAELGQGGMATVYLAVSLGTSGFRKLAVVKLIRPQYASDPDLIEMFLDEARLCARLNHPNIVQTYDVGIDDGQHLMAMEYLDGVSFNAAISRMTRDGRSLNFALRARVLLDVLEGLRYAHELKDYDGKPLQIVHRDVTPHNIFVTYDGQVKLLDFGIAKAATSSVQTATGVIKGKLTYMAPEQAFGDPVDARADLYAVGVMLWEALMGRRRFPAGLSDAAMFTRVASGEMPEKPNAAERGLPSELDAIILRALAPKPEDRFQTAGELHAALDATVRMMEPVSVRELGALLAVAFAEERQSIRQVIEDQFRRMESGRPTPMVAGPPALPTVHPPRGTHSSARASPGSMAVAQAAGEEVRLPPEGSTTKGVSTHATRLPEAKSRRIVAWGALGAILAASLATLGSRVLSHPGPDVHRADLGASVNQPPVDARVAPAAIHAVSPDNGVASAPIGAPAAPENHEEHREEAATATLRYGAPTFHRERARPSNATRDPSSLPESAPPQPDAGASPPPAAVDPPPFRTTTAKPKVQLERDNPWP
jgi:serine/threonine-protein kinase